jgi:hypothetical protein
LGVDVRQSGRIVVGGDDNCCGSSVNRAGRREALETATGPLRIQFLRSLMRRGLRGATTWRAWIPRRAPRRSWRGAVRLLGAAHRADFFRGALAYADRGMRQMVFASINKRR